MGRTKRKRQKKKGSISRNVRDASPECIRNASWASSHGVLTANLDVYIFPDRADGMKVSVMEQYDDMQRKVSFCDQLIHLVTLKDFKWAWSVVNTRSVYFGDEKRCQGIANGSMALAPYLDILNHSATAEVEAKYSKLTKRYEIFTKTSYRKGEQVFISYGAHNNDTLLLEYGFILKHNPHSTFQMDEVLRGIAAGNVERKNAILKGLNLTCDLSCTVDGPSWKLMTALRIWNMSNSELVHWQTVLQGHVSDKNERLCTEQLTLHCINLLSTIHKAITTISTQPHSSLHSSCMAIQLEYKHIVQNTINKLQAVVL